MPSYTTILFGSRDALPQQRGGVDRDELQVQSRVTCVKVLILSGREEEAQQCRCFLRCCSAIGFRLVRARNDLWSLYSSTSMDFPPVRRVENQVDCSKTSTSHQSHHGDGAWRHRGGESCCVCQQDKRWHTAHHEHSRCYFGFAILMGVGWSVRVMDDIRTASATGSGGSLNSEHSVGVANNFMRQIRGQTYR